MRSVMKHEFANIPSVNIERSTFDRSHGYKTTFNAGDLIPIFVDEALPGDTFKVKATLFARIATLIKPPMDNLFLETFFFSVPYRLVWQNWEKFNGEQKNPTDSTDFEIPQIVSPSGGYTTGSIYDYMGLPVGVANISHSALPLRAYAKIYDNWFRDENLMTSIDCPIGDGPDTYSVYGLKKRGKRHDYFTSCLPWPQKGTEVSMPLGSTAPVISSGVTPTMDFDSVTGTPVVAVSTVSSGGIAPLLGLTSANPAVTGAMTRWATTGMQVNLASATAATINKLREAFQLQRLFERDARGGTRYPEIIKSHFGVQDPQFDVLQRPQYLGGGSTPVIVHTVPQSSGSAGTGGYTDTPQANLSAYGTVQANGHGFTKSFTEHCIIIGIACVRADLTYQQGTPRMWSRKTRYDFYWPALAHLGEQGVLNKEIFTQGTSADDSVFGYQERYAEYRYKTSQITGKLRSNETGGTPLDMWHLAQDFATLPLLNQAFIEENVPMERIIAVTTEPHFIMDSYFQMTCTRPMPVYSVPGYIDHF